MIPFVVVRDELAPGRPEERVAVMDEDPDVSQASVLGIGGVPHELGAPRPVEWRWCADSARWASSGRHVDHRDRRRVMISM